GGGGERKTLRMVAQYADEWNVWSTPEIMAHKAAVLDEHCERLGRNPADIERSSVVLLFLVDTEAEADKLRAHDFGRPSLIGTPAQLQDQLAAYADAGVDELIIPDFSLGGGAKQDETLDRFLAEVAAPFRP
ncbi:MAG: LLM class flavin-dependent oxidoreductase, partial [Microthrixaceae bacterium]|nr:LLM class flavin-dependent oxidoreductase [Microthrixaceae bacterium]